MVQYSTRRALRRKVTEASVERDVGKWVADQGGLYIKFTPRGDVGWPDRIVILDGATIWLELKRPGKLPTDMQRYRMGQLQARGCIVLWGDNADDVIKALEEYL